MFSSSRPKVRKALPLPLCHRAHLLCRGPEPRTLSIARLAPRSIGCSCLCRPCLVFPTLNYCRSQWPAGAHSQSRCPAVSRPRVTARPAGAKGFSGTVVNGPVDDMLEVPPLHPLPPTHSPQPHVHTYAPPHTYPYTQHIHPRTEPTHTHGTHTLASTLASTTVSSEQPSCWSRMALGPCLKLAGTSPVNARRLWKGRSIFSRATENGPAFL